MNIAEISVPLNGMGEAEVERLWGRYRRGRGLEDRNRLWEHYYPLAVGLAGQVRRRMNHSFDVTAGDMAQMAAEGLLAAIETWEDGHGAKFKTWAYRKMWCRMMNELRGQDVMGRQGRMWANKAECGDESRRAMMAGRLAGCRRFTDCRDGDARNEPYGVSCLGETPGLDDQDEWERLVKGPPDRTRLILSLHFQQGLTLKQVGATVGISTTRVFQVIERAKGRIRERMEARCP